ncbi:MAG: hypothetical protein ABIG64_02975 [Candidatus Omnitrophota bacterium]
MKQTSKSKWIYLRIISLVLIQAFFCLNISYSFSPKLSSYKNQKQTEVATLSPQICISIESFQYNYSNYHKYFNQSGNNQTDFTNPDHDQQISIIDFYEQINPDEAGKKDPGSTQIYHLSWRTISLALAGSFIAAVEFFSFLQVLGLTGQITLLTLAGPYFAALFMGSLISVLCGIGFRGIGYSLAAARQGLKGKNHVNQKGVFLKIPGLVNQEQRKQIMENGKKVHNTSTFTLISAMLALIIIPVQIELAAFVIIPMVVNIILYLAKSINTEIQYQEKTKFNKIYCTWQTLIQAFIVPFMYLRIETVLKAFAQSPTITGLISALTIPVSLLSIGGFAGIGFLIVVIALIMHEMGHNSVAQSLKVERSFGIDKKGISMELSKELELEKIRMIVQRGIYNNKWFISLGMQFFWFIFFGIIACLSSIQIFIVIPLIIGKVNKIFSETEEDELFLEKTKGKNVFEILREVKDFVSVLAKSIKKEEKPAIILLGGYFAVGKNELFELINKTLKGSKMFNKKIRIISIDRLLKTESKREKNLSYPYNTYEYEKYIKMVEDFSEGKPIYLPFYLHIFSKRLLISKEIIQALIKEKGVILSDFDGVKMIKLDKAKKNLPVKNFVSSQRLERIKKQIKSKRQKPEKYLQIFKVLSEKPLSSFLVNSANDIYVRINNDGTGEIVEQIRPEKEAIHVFEFEQALTSPRARNKAKKTLVVMASQKKRQEYFMKRWRNGLRYLHLSEQEIVEKFNNFIKRENNDFEFKNGLLKAQLILNTEVPIAEQLQKKKKINHKIDEEKKQKLINKLSQTLSCLKSLKISKEKSPIFQTIQIAI